MDLALVAPPLLLGQEGRRDLKPPVNLVALATWLRARGREVSIVDMVGEGIALPAVLDRLRDVAPRAVGVPLYQATRRTAARAAEAIRGALPGARLLAGGPLVTTAPATLLDLPMFDVGVLGEGEETTAELLAAPSPDGIPGTARAVGGRLVVAPARPPLPDLDALPFLDWSLVPVESYFRFHESLGMPRWVFLSASRGCPWRCVYCATPTLWPGPFRRMSVDRVIAECAWQVRRHPGAGIGFLDDAFFAGRSWLDDFLAKIGKLGIRYCCIGRADDLAPGDAARLAATGCHYVALGVESGDPGRQERIRKRLDLGKVRRAVADLSAAGIETKGFFMLGFPDETVEEMAATVNFAVELRRLGLGECNFFPVSVYPGTPLAGEVPPEALASDVYEGFDPANRPVADVDAESIGEKRLSIYANVPAADVNRFVGRDRLLDLVRLAYRRAETATPVTPDEMRAAAGSSSA